MSAEVQYGKKKKFWRCTVVMAAKNVNVLNVTKREVGGGFMMGNTFIPVADSF